MSRTAIPSTLRQKVIERAKNRCEYCLYPQAASFLAFEMEHISAEGRVTVAILQMNHPERVLERARLLEARQYVE